MLHDASSSLPLYQRRLVVSGYLSRHRLTHGLSNLTNAGLDLGDRVIDLMLDRAHELWPVDVLTHPPLLADPWQREFAGDMSDNFDCFHLPGDRFLWFDTNVAHLDALRERLDPGLQTRAVASVEGLYRPVAAPRPMIRDEFVFPFAGLHIAAHRDKVAEEWDRLVDLTRTVAAGVGLPLLLVRRPGPKHYARDCLAALLPAPGGKLEPWMLAYELGDRFDDYLGVPDVAVLEFGISERVMAFCAHMQRGRAARFGSAVSPTQVFVEGSADAPAELRAVPKPGAVPKPRDAVSRFGLAPVVANIEAGRYRLLSEDYGRTHRLDRPLHDVLAEHDRRLVAESSEKLKDFLTENYSAGAAGDLKTEGRIVASPIDDHHDLFLNGPHAGRHE
jgi:hypothetical protein